MALRIVLADDHVLVRDGIRSLLEHAGFEVVGQAGDGQEALRLAEKLHPDAVVLDYAMPVLNGIDAARAMKKASDRTGIILLTMFTQHRFVMESFRAGVRGYVVKSAAPEELVQAIRAVCSGKTYLSPDASSALIETFLAGCEVQPSFLGDRERQVLQLVAEGKSSKQIADLLGISVKTAESHRAHLMDKLQIHDIAGLVRYAIREGLIQP